jgi:hypothetical protein
MSGRSRSVATTVFFEAQLVAIDEFPDHPIIDLEAALGEFGDKPHPRRSPLPWRAPATTRGARPKLPSTCARSSAKRNAAVLRKCRIQTITMCRRLCRIAPPPADKTGPGPNRSNYALAKIH